jgi:hypothetical protein
MNIPVTGLFVVLSSILDIWAPDIFPRESLRREMLYIKIARPPIIPKSMVTQPTTKLKIKYNDVGSIGINFQHCRFNAVR